LDNAPKILLYDLEITPTLGWTYGLYDTRVIRVEREPYVMCFAYKWLGQDKIHVVSQPDFDRYDTDAFNDKDVVRTLRDLMDEADIVIAHNAMKFDNRVANERFLAHGFTPPSPYKTVDTLLVARRYFRNGSNALNSLCSKLGIGEKSAVTHGTLWRDCVDGDMDSWKKMAEYNKQDIVMLEGLYLTLRPFISNHPNVAVYGKVESCPKCGSENIQYRGFQRSNVAEYRRIQCTDCGAWSRERVAEKTDKPSFVNVT
jgi:DNA-directed RNA polymerase subunit RPC12/RpoP